MVLKMRLFFHNSIIRGLVAFLSISLIINIINIKVSFYSPYISTYYSTILKSMKVSNDVIFSSLLVIIIDGFFGAILGAFFKLISDAEIPYLAFIIIYPVYWFLVIFACAISF